MPLVCVLRVLLFRALARPSSIRTLLLSGFVVLFTILLGFVLLRVVFVGFVSSLTGSV